MNSSNITPGTSGTQPSDTAHPVVHPQTPAHTNRVRFGVSLPWPIANVGIFVVYMNDDQWVRFNTNFQGLIGILTIIPGGQSVAARLVCGLS